MSEPEDIDEDVPTAAPAAKRLRQPGRLDTTSPVVTEEEQLGLAPLLIGHVGVCVDALPLGTSREFTGARGTTPHPFQNWQRPNGTPWAPEDFRAHVTRFIEDRCGFYPSKVLVTYFARHVLAPYFMRDELARFMVHRVEPCPGERLELEALYEEWRAMPLRAPGKNPAGVGHRTFRAPEGEWRDMLLNRGFDLTATHILNVRRK